MISFCEFHLNILWQMFKFAVCTKNELDSDFHIIKPLTCACQCMFFIYVHYIISFFFNEILQTSSLLSLCSSGYHYSIVQSGWYCECYIMLVYSVSTHYYTEYMYTVRRTYMYKIRVRLWMLLPLLMLLYCVACSALFAARMLIFIIFSLWVSPSVLCCCCCYY